ncbi:His Kinase A (phospho-acceptor) domain-containing protein [Reichenbachiella faecimaris]|uniref:histidine kinase n=1 Tax=Reichenbachiella faecimaris TaxID=692418 RepID=A0A1W2GRF2_REIFA|nr:tetratricopeptide repeat-containing sensor histidine kinase [Reichenbachiella faecimaris]SMD38992.1 His Kinase A (phospho-acceptor) domain-containing protein [Reichenbachiella faecimaris]
MTTANRPVSFFVLFWALFSFSGICQTKVDSLLVELNEASEREGRIEIYLRLSLEVEEAEESLQYAKSAFSLLQDSDETLLKGKTYQCLGRGYVNQQQPDSANYYLNQSLAIFDNLEEAQYKAKSLYYQAILFEQKHHFDSARYSYVQAILLSDSINDHSKSALYNLYLGGLLNTKGDNVAALRHLKSAHEYYIAPQRVDSAWISYNSLAIVYDEMGLYPEALGYYLKAYELIEKTDDKEAKLILTNNLGTIYHELGKMEESKDFFAQAMEMARASSQGLDEAMILNNLSILYTEERDTLGALKLIRRAHSILMREESNCDLAYSYEGLGEVMTWQKKYDSADYYYNQAMNWATTCEMTGCQTSIYRNMGLLALQQKNLSMGVTLLNKSLNLGRKAGYLSEMQETTRELYEFYNSINDHKNALKYHLLYSNLKDSLFNAQSTEKIARMTAEYDFRREVESLEYEKMADEMRLNDELRQKESYQNSILIVLVLTLLLAATLGRSYYLVQNHNKKLTALNEEKNTLMGVVAHDLRSPLNNIKGLMSLVKMEKSSLTPEQSHYFQLVDDTMERMRDMIDRVLDVSVVEDMKVNLNLKKVDLGQTMNFVAGNFELLASKKSINIHSSLDIETHFVFADYNYLLQVIENLVSNAIKFSKPQKNIFMNVFQEEGNETMIIRDEGPGISEEDQKKLFTKFQKLSAKPTDNEQSTGLGLSIVKKFVDAMDAEIRCESEVGKGTSFIIRFKTAVEQELV